MESSGKNNTLSLYALQNLLSTIQTIAFERDTEVLCEKVLFEAMKLSKAEGGTLYLTSKDNRFLDFVLINNTELNIFEKKFQTKKLRPSIDLYADSEKKNYQNAYCYAFNKKQILNILDIYHSQEHEFNSSKLFDEINNYQTKSCISVPMMNKLNKVVGVFQLINAKNEKNELIPFSEEVAQILQIFSNFAACSLEKLSVDEHQKDLLVSLSTESDSKRLVERILIEAKSVAKADGGSLYLVNNKKQCLDFSLLINDSLNLYMGGVKGNPLTIRSVPLYNIDTSKNYDNVVSYAFHKKKPVVLDDVYLDSKFDFSGTRRFDTELKYRSKSFLVVPLLNHDNEVIGILQLLNAKDNQGINSIPFDSTAINLVNALSFYAAIVLNNMILVEDLNNLLNAFVKSIAKAIDAKSPHTSAHCQRIPILMELITQAACDDETIFKDFSLNEDQWHEIRVASWLHDCGKLSTPDAILNKATKLHLINDGIETIKTRFSSLKHQISSEFYQRILLDIDNKLTLQNELTAKLSSLDDDCAFVISCNKGREFMEDSKKERIKEISKIQWIDQERESQPLINDTELYNLCIEKGTLTHEERQEINNHMNVTIDMLESLPFPQKLQNIPEYAGGHHEKIDGSGFPKGLKGHELSIPAKMMAIADIYEALTSNERPYKDPMKVSTSLNILKKMVDCNHIDGELFDLFVRSKVWQKYAIRELPPEQLDITEYSY